MSLNVTIPDTFNGPLDLLLHLIRRDEMDIYDIPIAQLTKSYLDEMNNLKIIDVDEGAEFLDLASRLLEIKSRMLIPPEEREEEGEDEDENLDPRTGLVEALLEYRRFKDAAKMLGDMAEEQARRYPRVSPRMEFTIEGGDAAGANANELMLAFQNMLDKMLTDFADAPDVITYTEVSIATRISQIEENLLAVEKTRFSRLLSDSPTKSEMVGLFIAILELVRQGRLIARQADNFSDIVLERREPPAEQTASSRGQRRKTSRAPKSFFPPVPPRAGSGRRKTAAPRRPVPAFPGASSPRPAGAKTARPKAAPFPAASGAFARSRNRRKRS